VRARSIGLWFGAAAEPWTRRTACIYLLMRNCKGHWAVWWLLAQFYWGSFRLLAAILLLLCAGLPTDRPASAAKHERKPRCCKTITSAHSTHTRREHQQLGTFCLRPNIWELRREELEFLFPSFNAHLRFSSGFCSRAEWFAIAKGGEISLPLSNAANGSTEIYIPSSFEFELSLVCQAWC
jgi:hypothetical protein